MNRSKSAVVQFVVAVGFVLALCGSVRPQSVKYNFMPGTDFSKYHTYKWVTMAEQIHPNQIMDQEIRQAIDAQMSAKGFTRTDSDKADMYIGYQCAVDQERQWNGFGMGGGLRWGGMASATSSTIENGTIVFDAYDPATKQLVWSGRAAETLNPSSNQEKDMQRLNKAMAKLLKNFPPVPKK